MILPIYAFGQPVLKRPSDPIDETYPNLDKLIQDMFETMYNAKGVGLAAPQVGLGIRLFIVDTVQTNEKVDVEKGIKQAFINPVILKQEGKLWSYEEGCLSIPLLTGDVERYSDLTISYQNEQFETIVERFAGMEARVIQHEYDHIEGVLFVDRLKPLKRRLMKRKLEAIRTGNIPTDYKMKFNARLLT